MPNRIIKESIRTSRNVNALTDFQFRVWLYLITYVDDFGRGSADPELLKSFVFPRRKGVTEKQIQDVLNVLANTGMIILYEVDGESFFYFSNWEAHQRIRNQRSKFPEPEELTATCGDLRQPAADCGLNPNPNPNPNPEKRVCPSGAGRSRSNDLFDQFWQVYPRKLKKQDALKAWRQLKVDESTLEQILVGVQAWARCSQWTQDGGQFVPYPATFLRARQWEEVPQAETKPGKQARRSDSDIISGQTDYTDIYK